jgi:glyoxylase-like metal-dependent hydrolase (beta-lactamase superfamily II)
MIIKDGGGPRTAASFLSDVPQTTLEQVAHEHDLDPNRLDFSINILLVNTGSDIILIDTGLGHSDLPNQFKPMGVDAAAIDVVIITHGHFDHIGGILNSAGEFVYPNARYVIAKTEWEYATAAEHLLETAPTTPIWKALQAHQDRVTILDTAAGYAEVAAGVSLIHAPGHTPGHVAVRIESSGERLLHMVDTVHHFIQLAHTEWSPNFDFNKLQSAETRQRLLEYAAREGILTLAYHFSFPGLGHVLERSGGLRWQVYEG